MYNLLNLGYTRWRAAQALIRFDNPTRLPRPDSVATDARFYSARKQDAMDRLWDKVRGLRQGTLQARVTLEEFKRGVVKTALDKEAGRDFYAEPSILGQITKLMSDGATH